MFSPRSEVLAEAPWQRWVCRTAFSRADASPKPRTPSCHCTSENGELCLYHYEFSWSLEFMGDACFSPVGQITISLLPHSWYLRGFCYCWAHFPEDGSLGKREWAPSLFVALLLLWPCLTPFPLNTFIHLLSTNALCSTQCQSLSNSSADLAVWIKMLNKHVTLSICAYLWAGKKGRRGLFIIGKHQHNSSQWHGRVSIQNTDGESWKDGSLGKVTFY